MSTVRNLLSRGLGAEPHPLGPEPTEQEIREALQEAEEISRRTTPSLIYDTSPVMLKLRAMEPEEVEKRIQTGQEYGIPHTWVPGMRINGAWNREYTVVLQERLEDVEPDTDMVEDAISYVDELLPEYGIQAGLDDFLYKGDKLVCVDATDDGSFYPEPHRIEGIYNELILSAVFEDGVSTDEMRDIVFEESDYAHRLEPLKI